MTTWITEHERVVEQASKPVVFEEYGLHANRDPIYKAWTGLFEIGADGDYVWIIAGQVNRCDGGPRPALFWLLLAGL